MGRFDRQTAKNGGKTAPSKAFFAVGRLAMVALLCASLVSLPGCKTSLVLAELLFDQNAENTDENNSSRFLRNILDSLDMTEELAQLVQKDTDLQREQAEEEKELGKEQSDETASQASYEENATSQSEASRAGDGATTSSTKNKGDGKGNSSGNGNRRGNGNGNNPKKNQNGSDPDKSIGTGPVYHGDGGTGDVYGENGNYNEVPTGVQTVVAFGECANMVVSFAGEHALSGADANFLKNSFIKKAYKDKDIANAKGVKVSKKGIVKASEVVKLKPDAVLLSGSSYSLSSKGLAALKNAKIDVVYLPAFTSASKIVEVANSIGKMFGSDTLSGDDAKANAKKYVDWHNDVVEDVMGDEGLAGDTNYDTGKDNDGPVGNYTIYIDKWDDAIYYATPDDALSWTDKNGVAVSKVGYKWSPMSYYLSVGGTQSVSAGFKAKFYDTSALYYVWQFNLGRVPTVYSKNWANVSISTSPLSNSGTSDLLVKAADGTTLGSSNFSYVIASNQTVAKKMKASVKAANKKKKGIYATYGSVKGSDGSGTGFLSKTGEYCSAAISGSFKVETNPHGLYSNWISGSAESVLEAAWASDLNNGTSKLTSYVKEYYKLFYGVELSAKQVKKIVAGAKG